MKLYQYSLACMLGLGILASCADRLDLVNPNQQTSGSFGYTIDDLEESVIAAYNHIRIAMPMEGFLPLASAKTENLTDYPAMLFWRLPYGE